MEHDFTLDLADETATLQFAAILAKALVPNFVIYLHGDLGAGKTTLVRGVMHALGFAGKVKSPTYTLVEMYEIELQPNSKCHLYHFDLYRFNDEEEWNAAGFRDYFNARSVCIIEWPEKAQQVLPTPDIDIVFSIQSIGRKIQIIAHSVLGQQCLQAIISQAIHLQGKA